MLRQCAISPLRYCPLDNARRDDFIGAIVRGTGGYTAAEVGTTQRFDDVPSSSPAYPYVQVAYTRMYTSGCVAANPPSKPLPSFCPADGLSRAAASVFLSRSLFNTSF